jgi:hypothetical protein
MVNRFASLMLLVALFACALKAQSIGVAANGAEGNQRSGLGRMHGAQVDVSIPLEAQTYRWRMGLSHYTRGGDAFGSTCVGGPVPPGTCEPEALAQRNSLTLGSLGVGAEKIHRYTAIGMFADVSAGSVSKRDRGLSTGAALSASRGVLGVGVGVEGRVQPVASRFAAYAGVSAVGLRTLSATNCDDCYVPFPAYWTIARWYGGVSIGTRRR